MPLIWSKNWLNLSAEALDEEGRRKKILRKFRKCKKVERTVPVKKVKFEWMEKFHTLAAKQEQLNAKSERSELLNFVCYFREGDPQNDQLGEGIPKMTS